MAVYGWQGGNAHGTKAHILDAACRLVSEVGHEDFHVTVLAARAGVGVPTVYYYFDSREELIAEAQTLNWVEFNAPTIARTVEMREALTRGDRGGFVVLLRATFHEAWRARRTDDGMGIVRQVSDIWTNDMTRARMTMLMRDQADRWRDIVGTAQQLGWLREDVNGDTIPALFWAAAYGQAVVNLAYPAISVDEVVDTYIRWIVVDAEQ